MKLKTKYSQRKCRMLCRALVEKKLRYQSQDWLIHHLARLMKERGWYSPNTSEEQTVHHIRNLLTRIKEEGFKYGRYTMEELEARPDTAAKERVDRKKLEEAGLFSPEQLGSLKHKNANKKWTPEETDLFLDLVLAGWSPLRLSLRFDRDVKAIKRHFEEILYNERNKGAFDYLPAGKRTSRAGVKLTSLEHRIIKRHRRDKIPPEVTARLLQRPVNQIDPDFEGQAKVTRMKEAVNLEDMFSPSKEKRMKETGLMVDCLLACRYLYWCKPRRSIISDQAYDVLKEEVMEFGGGFDVLSKPASDKVVCYPAHIRSLAFYLLFKHMESTGKWESDALPPEYFKKTNE